MLSGVLAGRPRRRGFAVLVVAVRVVALVDVAQRVEEVEGVVAAHQAVGAEDVGGEHIALVVHLAHRGGAVVDEVAAAGCLLLRQARRPSLV